MFVHCCHCLNCQRQTGSAFVINLLIEADRVELLAEEPQPVDVPRDDGSAQRIYRCPTCQVAVFSEYGRPEVRFVRAGTLDEPSSITPDVHIFTRSKVPWVALPSTAPAFDVYYDSKALWPAREPGAARRRPRESLVGVIEIAIDQRVGQLALPKPELEPVSLECAAVGPMQP